LRLARQSGSNVSEVILIVIANTARVRRLSELELQHISVKKRGWGPPLFTV
jgi:hypothetical protein